MQPYTTGQIAQILNAKLEGDPNLEISTIATDSRTPSKSKGTLFVAIVGKHHNGHKFISELYNFQHIRAFMVSDTLGLAEKFPQATFIVVKNTLHALQKLATYHRAQFKYPVVGITGSNGKTIVKEWLNQLLSPDYSIVRSPKSYNSQIGVPLSVLQMDSNFNLGIFEAGISLPGEMLRLQPIINPQVGIFTNIGLPHQENFEDLDEKITEKLKLFKSSELLIYCKDHELVDRIIYNDDTLSGVKLLSWGVHPQSTLHVESTEEHGNGRVIRVKYGEETFSFEIPFTDQASYENAMHCLSLLFYLNIDRTTIADRMAKLSPVAMRLELKKGVNGCTIINDSYNSDLGSLSIALDFLLQQKQHDNRVLILSDILQSGYAPELLYSMVAQLVEEKEISHIIGIGKNISRYAHLFDISKEFYSNTLEFTQSITRRQFSNSAILIKGSRNFHFERIVAILEEKVHRTVMEINLNSMVHNLNHYRNQLNPGVKLMVLVKAFSYGSGSYEIANLLQFNRVDYLGVAFADEGVSLREAGIALPIIVLNPSYGAYELMIENRLEPEIYNFEGLAEFANALDRMGVNEYNIHLKIDTGMHRLGFTGEQLPELTSTIQSLKSIRIASIFSHLAASEDSGQDEFTQSQIALFSTISDEIISAIGYKPLRHILNSAGIERFPHAQFDMVRLGIGLHGISPTQQDKLLPVSTLKSKVIQVKHLQPGETVGYNRMGKINKPTTVAAIPIGYADGLNRKLGNGIGKMMINGVLVPTIGNISMDTCTLDATGVDVKVGDDVVIFGSNPTIMEVSQALNTIPYEVLTSVSQRVKRIYFQE
ncbi:MAG TPA: bifunctional UDP-N-acetylmuramoyl-tripeptide:D-alanyl-D-alanine ligase/alanine racemase [Tenuifilaceae bacterium]|nr:bifunctional UDP-N-acetylmuramoyl-tripeptide:D-alanyl-D-alanine ligase/alanine racemase [Bacteroidales bacterium]HOW21018.1 bifunctional UDP-N-acetylmuramoyl-tripeptide:D-alanyl-D-alanine ligase/alanine racemase [Tenuifilaceae bacterium]HPA67211.1 bifunctional UDP-N-acetylmuramoyl-tripeptide:D-alanyl-D-alanine ligase/alanine racemase [Tenuifilaceae bacterium]